MKTFKTKSSAQRLARNTHGANYAEIGSVRCVKGLWFFELKGDALTGLVAKLDTLTTVVYTDGICTVHNSEAAVEAKANCLEDAEPNAWGDEYTVSDAQEDAILAVACLTHAVCNEGWAV